MLPIDSEDRADAVGSGIFRQDRKYLEQGRSCKEVVKAFVDGEQPHVSLAICLDVGDIANGMVVDCSIEGEPRLDVVGTSYSISVA